MNGDKMRFPKWPLILLMFFVGISLNSIAHGEGELTVTLSGSGTGIVKSSDNLINCGVDCQENYQENKRITLNASGNENSYFAGWSGDPCSGVTKPSCSFTMDHDKNITAIFELKPTLVLTKSGNGKGSVKSSTRSSMGSRQSSSVGIDCGPDCPQDSALFDHNRKIVLKATVDPYSTFLGWDGFECTGITSPQCTILMDQSKEVTARFELPDISISPTFYDFKDVRVRQSSPPASFTIMNNGTGNLKLTKIELLGTDARLFKITRSMTRSRQQTLTLSPGGQYSFSVTFSPTSIGLKTATLRITSNDPDASITEIALTGKGTDSIFTASNTPMVAGAIVQTFNLLGLITDLNSLSPIGNYPGNIKMSTTTPGHFIIPYHKDAISLPSMECEESGTISLKVTWDGPTLPTDPSQIIDLKIQMTFDSCTQFGCSINGMIQIIFEGPLSDPTKIKISVPELTYSNTNTGEDVTIKDLMITITGFTMEADHLISGTIEVSGTLSGTSGGSPIDMECEQFKIEFVPSSTGTTITISGRIKPSCLGDWVTITTPTPIFIPMGDACPTAGEIVAISGEYTVRIVISSNYNITVYFNETLIQTYTNCRDVAALCCNKP
ncbi:MAG: choice-of-anchor D domain-containing protein [Deltaproteobacteria bacterium]|nr:choice-of-anchor D domain-containing protein [Deltaproteobacteria bacterium]